MTSSASNSIPQNLLLSRSPVIFWCCIWWLLSPRSTSQKASMLLTPSFFFKLSPGSLLPYQLLLSLLLLYVLEYFRTRSWALLFLSLNPSLGYFIHFCHLHTQLPTWNLLDVSSFHLLSRVIPTENPGIILYSPSSFTIYIHHQKLLSVLSLIICFKPLDTSQCLLLYV